MSCTRPLHLPVASAAALFSLLILTVTPGQAASVRLSWTAPTKHADGTSFTDLSGYKVYSRSNFKNHPSPLDVGNIFGLTLLRAAASGPPHRIPSQL